MNGEQADRTEEGSRNWMKPPFQNEGDIKLPPSTAVIFQHGDNCGNRANCSEREASRGIGPRFTHSEESNFDHDATKFETITLLPSNCHKSAAG